MNTTTLPAIGFIGTGIMGNSMALHILKSGYRLYVFNRSKEKTSALIEQGALWCESPKEVAAHAASYTGHYLKPLLERGA